MYYGLLKNNKLYLAPSFLPINGQIVTEPTEEQYLSCGYKKVIEENGLDADLPLEYTTEDYYVEEDDVIYIRVRLVKRPTQERIDNLRAKLSEYDYIGIKIAMGVATQEEYADQIAYTETLRRRIRDLENGEDVE